MGIKCICMKKLTKILFAIVAMVWVGNCFAQSGIITTVAGNGLTSFSGDGGPATSASFVFPYGVAVDGSGNMYIADFSGNRVRKVTPAGVISTFAGNGVAGSTGDGGPATVAELFYPNAISVDATGNVFICECYRNKVRKVNVSGVITTIAGIDTAGYSGDGGPAVLAKLNYPLAVSFDLVGNILISDAGNNRVRMINSTGIISTIVGNGAGGYTGDGGPATLASLHSPQGIVVDGFGNLYISDSYNRVVRKVNASGVITTYAGNGSYGFSGDGGPATNAAMSNPYGITIDATQNIYITDNGNYRIRKISPAGIISTFAGNGIMGFSGDGGMATAAELDSMNSLCMDNFNNLYIVDGGNSRIRKVNGSPAIVADSFSVYTGNSCINAQFEVVTNSFSAGQHVVTYFGDGTSADSTCNFYLGKGIVNFNNAYPSEGTYTVKHILYDGLIAVDSITYPHFFSFCQVFPIKFYYDSLGTCIYDPFYDPLFFIPHLIAVDSNGTPIDTVSATSGLYYTAYGAPGDVYKFTVLNSGGLIPSCPTSGIIYDTMITGSIGTKTIGFICSGTSGYDLLEHIGILSGRHQQNLSINLENTFCNPVATTYTLNFSNKYVWGSSSPAPTTIMGNTATWVFPSMSYAGFNKFISVYLHVPGTWLIPGDTVMTDCAITPTSGDIDTTNNTSNCVDTVRSSYDPNEMSVSPSGCIPSTVVTPLQYTIMFENTGNDTAHNIYILDTLPSFVDQHSLRIVSASNTMNVSKWQDAAHQSIFKFEFPSINLLDSSHHNQCDGMVMFNINTLAGLPSGTTISNQAGIYFDDNPVVMTNAAKNVTGCALAAPNLAKTPTPTIYPNPANEVLTIKITNGEYTSCTITNMMGQQMQQVELPDTTTRVAIKTLPTGVYYITFKGGNVDVVVKFVKM